MNDDNDDRRSVLQSTSAAMEGRSMEHEASHTLIAAATRGDASAVRHLLARGASVHAADPSGRTALISAAYGGHNEVARLLLAAGADPNIANGEGVTPMSHAYRDGHTAIADLLEQRPQRGPNAGEQPTA